MSVYTSGGRRNRRIWDIFGTELKGHDGEFGLDVGERKKPKTTLDCWL